MYLITSTSIINTISRPQFVFIHIIHARTAKGSPLTGETMPRNSCSLGILFCCENAKINKVCVAHDSTVSLATRVYLFCPRKGEFIALSFSCCATFLRSRGERGVCQVAYFWSQKYLAKQIICCTFLTSSLILQIPSFREKFVRQEKKGSVDSP